MTTYLFFSNTMVGILLLDGRVVVGDDGKTFLHHQDVQGDTDMAAAVSMVLHEEKLCMEAGLVGSMMLALVAVAQRSVAERSNPNQKKH